MYPQYSIYGQNMRGNQDNSNQMRPNVYGRFNPQGNSNQRPNTHENNYLRNNIQGKNNNYSNLNQNRPYQNQNFNNPKAYNRGMPNNPLMNHNKKYSDLEIRTNFRSIFNTINDLSKNSSYRNDDNYQLNKIKTEFEKLESFNGNEYSDFIGQLYEVSKDDKVLNLGYDAYKKDPKNGDEELKKIISDFKYDIVLYKNQDNTKENVQKLKDYIKKKTQKNEININKNNMNNGFNNGKSYNNNNYNGNNDNDNDNGFSLLNDNDNDNGNSNYNQNNYNYYNNNNNPSYNSIYNQNDK